jgi:PhnB protein
VADELDDEALTSIAAALAGCPSAEFKNRLRRSLERSIEMTSVADTSVHARGVRPGFTPVTTYLMAPDIEPVIAFARKVFGAEETLRTVGGAGGIHCELRIGDSRLMCGGGAGVYSPVVAPRLVGLHIYVDDVDTVYQRALEAGGESLGAPADRPYGERSGFVKDPAGNHWYIATRLGPTDSAEAPRTLTPHMYVQHTPGKGASEFIDFLQTAFGAHVEFRHDSPEGMVAHAVMRLQGGALAIGEGQEPGFAAPAAFYLYVDDCDALYTRAVRAGATALHAPADQPYGDRMGSVADSWGNEWFIATHLGQAQGPRPKA